MWDMRMAHPLGRLSKRSFITIVAASLVTIFAYLLLASPIAHAASDATWKGTALNYEGNSYTGPLKATGNESFNLPAGTQIYRYTEPTVTGLSQTKSHFIYFGANEDVSKATSAKYVEYIYVPVDKYSQPSNSKTISVEPGGPSNNGGSSCAVPGGLGWIICPISTTLAGAMDWVYGTLAEFMKTQPLQTTQQSSMFQAWNVIRNIANVIFVIAFIILIYSQLTGIGISNYGIKKILPRLAVAAVTVNLSYYICALAIDLSNVLGTSTHDLLEGLRHTMFENKAGTPSDASIYSWSSVVGFILSGGTLAASGVLGAHLAVVAAGGTVTAMIYMVLPFLLGIFLAVLVVLLILAARQALIVCLVIVSPLAFVASLLPGTDKWFDRWKDVFITMLVFFPAFSFVFSGAQLAGSMIIENASSINMIILGLAVQVAPLVITPLLLKLSGRVLGTIAGVVNNPKKGLIDRTRNWAGARAEMHKQRGLGDGETRPYNLMRNYARHHDNRNRYLKERTDNFTGMSDNRYFDTDMHSRQDLVHREVHEDKEITEKVLDRSWNEHQLSGHALEQDLKLRVLSDEAAKAKGEIDKRYENFRAGFGPVDANGNPIAQSQGMVDLLNRAEDTTQALAIQSMASQRAKDKQSSNLTAALIAHDDLQMQAGGVEGKEGADIALAQAINTQRSDFGKNVEAARSIMKHYNFSTDEKQQHALGNQFTKNGRTFSADDIYTREAAIEDQLKAAPYFMGDEIIKKAVDADFAQFRETIASTMESAGWSSKAAYYDGEASNAVRQGTSTVEYLKQHAVELVAQGKVSPKVLADNHKSAATFIRDAIQDHRAGTVTVDMAQNLNARFGSFNDAIAELKSNAHTALEDPRLNVALGDRTTILRDIDTNL